MQSVNKLKATQTIHMAFCAAVLLFAIVAFITVRDRIHFDASFNQDIGLYPLFPILGVVTIIAGMKIYKKQLSDIEHLVSFEEKFAKYQVAFLIRCAFLQAGALMNVSGFLVTANLVFLIAFMLPFFFLAKFRPNKTAVIEDLNLQYPDTNELD
jgi:hypothetical protein